jgi:4a-hydroxytetrahydrobiopterin dehydratase
MGSANDGDQSVSAAMGLSPMEIEAVLATCKGWRFVDGACCCTLIFSDFVGAFAFMTGAALVSEHLGHHPEWSNTYNRVSIRLFTHDAGAVTAKDIEWIRRVLPLQCISMNNQ